MALWIGVASAHVTVWPQSSTPGAWEKYTMRVPTERENPTVKVVLKIPSGVELEQYEPVPGWKFSEQKNASGEATTAIWTATGSGILPGQFLEFPFVAKNPNHAGQIAWNAYQYYKDGTIVEWTGKPGSDTPHSITTITQQATGTATTATGAHGEQANETTDSAAKTHSAQQAAAAANTSTPGWLAPVSIVALVLGVISLFVSALSLRRRS
ncbi:MAG: YcnI family protein [Alicyclobacillus herbarius]|nr:YcnI family protein [Alicyclobacillus herbarius]